MSKAGKAIGRPKKPSALRKNIGFKVSDEEYALIVKACDRVHRSLSEWCRMRLVNQAKAELGLPTEDFPEG
jgi:hypothetical protein